MSMTKPLNQRGDTIVEVLVAIAVLSLILAGAYVTARRSQNVNQASQERSVATSLVQTQIEGMKALLKQGKTIPTPGAFCVNNARTDFAQITPDPFSQSLATTTLPFDGDCGNQNGFFNLAIEPVSAGSDTYRIVARWDKVGGQGRDEILMYNRIHN